MARQIENFNQVQSVIADTVSSEVTKGIADFGQALVRRSQEAKIQKTLSETSLALNDLTREWQISNQSDPTSEENVKKYKDARSNLFAQMGKNISPMFRGSFEDAALRLAQGDDQSLQSWQFKQLHENSISFVNESIRNNSILANTDGKSYASGAMSDVEALASFGRSRQSLMDYGSKNLGQETTEQLLISYDKDYMKSFLSGVAETNPQAAISFLMNDTVKEMLTPDENTEMINVINTTQKKQQLAAALVQSEGGSVITDIVNDQNSSFFDKRLQIDQMEFSGQLSSKLATKARRVLESQKNVDSITSTPVMSEIVTQMYDLNAMQEVNSEDFLKGVENIREKILSLQASGKLTAPDVQKLNNRLTSLTSAKVSQATLQIGYTFYDANKKFESLPPEYRAQATRELFYKTDGMEDVTNSQYNSFAQDIIDNINVKRRQKTGELTKKAMIPDEQILKDTGYTIDDVNETAEKYGLTPEQVIMRLRQSRSEK